MKLGTAYYPDYFPSADWASDLDRMKAAGIEYVRIIEFAWSWYQPEPERWTWDGLDRFLDFALERKIGVCMSTPTATPPPWFFERYPDARLMDEQGHLCRAHRHMTCWNHPEGWNEAAQTIETLVKRYGTHPAVWGWQIDNEPNYAEDPNGFYDFNPHAINAAQEWLKEQYGTLDQLNEAWFGSFWSQRYNRWEQIWRTHSPKSNPNAYLAFLRWRESNMAQFVHKQAALLRANSKGQKIGVNVPETGIPFSLQIGQDYWAQGRGLDWIGTDLYVASGKRESDMAALRYSCDLMRSVQESVAPEGEFLIAETQAGPHLRSWRCTFAGEAWDADFLSDCLHVYAERGATQSWLFMWRPTHGGREIGMNGLQNFEGEDSPRTELVRQLAANPASYDASVRAYADRPVALVHYSQDSLRHLMYFEPMARAARIMLGVHRLLDAEGFRIRFLNDAEMLADIPEGARLVLPLSPILPPAAQDAVIRWQGQKTGRQLGLGPDTGLLDANGNWLRRDNRPLWKWLGVEPTVLCDIEESIEIAGAKVDRFRVFEAQPGAKIVSSAPWRGRTIPTLLECHPGVFLHAYDWTGLDAAHGAQAIPV
jgi:hypothetical protein